MGSAREAAMLTLTACDKQGAWSEGHLKRILKESALDRRDAALATRLCFGTLDWYLERRCTGGLKKLEPKVLSILRLSLYQILYMDKIPPSAAVNEGVQLTKKHCRNPRAAGMVNGVLRGILRDMPLPPPQGKDELETIALQTSHPRWLVEEFAQVLGVDGVKAWAQADNCQPPTGEHGGMHRGPGGGGAGAGRGGGTAPPLVGRLPAPEQHRRYGAAERLPEGLFLHPRCGGTPDRDGGKCPAGPAGFGLLCRSRRQVLCRWRGHEQSGGNHLL